MLGQCKGYTQQGRAAQLSLLPFAFVWICTGLEHKRENAGILPKGSLIEFPACYKILRSSRSLNREEPIFIYLGAYWTHNKTGCNKPEASSVPLGDQPECGCSSRSSRFLVRSLGSHTGSLEPPFPTWSRPVFSLGCGWLGLCWIVGPAFPHLGFSLPPLLHSSSSHLVRAVPPSSLSESSPHIWVLFCWPPPWEVPSCSCGAVPVPLMVLLSWTSCCPAL